MHVLSKALWSSAGLAFLMLGAGCGDSDKGPVDAAVDLRPPTPDVFVARDLSVDLPLTADANLPLLDAAVADVPPASDTTKLDAATPSLDSPLSRLDTPVVDTGYDLRGYDGASVIWDGAPARLEAGADTPADVAPDGFSPGPATLMVVNSGNTGQYNLADGTWKVFYFEATAGQLYCISGLSGIARGYVGTSTTVSPSDYQDATDANGNLAFRAANTQRYYVAVAVSGGGASGSFQVADGGQLLALGANSVTLPAPDLDNYYFFRFPVTQGHAYSVSVTGTSTTSVGLGLSAKAERASNGQFSYPLRGSSGPLPFSDEAVPATSVADSYSGYYFLFLHVYSAINVTVTITQTS